MKRLFIEPLDVLMFRSERPFIARESYVAKLGVISPLTFEGAIKSKIFLKFCEKRSYSPSFFQRGKKESEQDFKNRVAVKMNKDNEIKEILEIIGHPAVNLKPELNVLGIFFAKRSKYVEHFPLPNDIVKEDRENGKFIKVRVSEKIKLHENLSAVLPSEYSKIKGKNALIVLEELKNYLWGKIPKIKKIKHRNTEIDKPYLKETRIGIQIKRQTKKTVEGHLYTAEFLRLLEDWGFIVWYTSPKEIPSGIIRLGGEGKGATCRKIEEINLHEKLNFSELIKEINEKGKFKLYLATPSYFNGYKPPKNILEKELGINNLKLVAALPGKPIYIGGYDFAMNKEKPLRRWVNAGAVYYYKFEGKIKDNSPLPIKIIDKNIDMRCAFIGRW